MLRNLGLLGIGLLGGLMLVQSGIQAADHGRKVDMSKVPPASDRKGLLFEKDIKPILEKSCIKCHGGDNPKSKYLVDTRASVIKGGQSGEAAVIPGHSDKSPLVLYTADAVEEMEMPPVDKRDRYPALTKEQIGLLRAWIDQGAK
jgi:hypothetical protein